MSTRNVVLTDRQEQLISDLITAGRYQNASEAMRAGLRLLEREEAELDEIKDRLTKSLQQARAGEFAEGSGADAVRRAFKRARADHK